MSTEIISEGGTESLPGKMDINTILDMALQERSAMLSSSPLLQEFQKDIDKTINGFKDVKTRLESLALAARTFNIKRGIPARIYEIQSAMKLS